MLTLYHSPYSRSSRVIAQLMLMGELDAVEVITVDVLRHDGVGRRDPHNAHPEGKVPYLVTEDGQGIRESAAIMMYLDEVFGQPFSPEIGSPKRGAYLSWMAYAGGVLDPVLVAAFSGLDHPAITGTFRSIEEVCTTLAAALNQGPFLLGDELSVADILLASPFQWAPHLMPDNASIKAWVGRVGDRLDGETIAAYEARATAQLSTQAGT
ncbi:glutathione S-transferase family protein [Phaeobacter porticola]|uniref:Glutathione S-transferase domain-containing protein n=1 Tax=Phaeobacter porticola TaxID=1844006 RepID=A0A1L3I3P4_9RHOB|nr:glutathione S-transferase family protein [Phaeobacter porticola]APG46754.1 glutathione S-transferase domain-containing protein [Phaeobacter porticola]